MRAPLVLVPMILLGCGGDPNYLIVSVDQRPSVHGVEKLKVTLSNAGSMRSDELALDGHTFPVTFSIAVSGRTGEIGLGIDGLDAAGSLVGRGEGVTTAESTETANVLLDPADFVVNTTIVSNQYLTNDFEAVGLQLATLQTGVWTAVYRDDCTSCDIYGRRFDGNGIAVESALAANDQEFKVTTTPTTSGSIPAVAASGLGSIVAWDYFDTTGGTQQGVACRGINDQGASATNQVSLSTDLADVVTATGLSNGNFVVTWQTFMTSQVVRGIIVTPTCTPVTAVLAISPTGQTFAAHRSHAASNQAAVLYAWIVDGEVRVKTGTNTTVSATEAILIPKTATEEVDFVRVAPWGAGFAVAARWSAISGGGPGKIEVYRTNASGNAVGRPITITENSGSDFASDKAFGIARRMDDALLVVWHYCPTGSSGSCDVYGRILRPTGAAVGKEFIISTSTGGDQINPSVISVTDTFVAAWNDGSLGKPDDNGSAVRARVLYPIYDNARGILGATCGASSPGSPNCDMGLACALGSDGVQRCYELCTPPTCTNGGTCTMVDETTSACTF